MKTLTWDEVTELILEMHERIQLDLQDRVIDGPTRVYGIPKGGSIVAAMLSTRFKGKYYLEERIQDADIVVDDLVDSGKTARRAAGILIHEELRTPYFDALIRKTHSPKAFAPKAKEMNGWIVFPWELSMNGESEDSAEDAVVRIIERVGEDPNREGLIDTPKRVIKAFEEMTSGYVVDLSKLCKVFNEKHADEMVVLKGIRFVSLCEHHLLPFSGVASVGYIPKDGRVIGLSKLARIVEAYARRFQNQERLTHQISSFLMEIENLSPLGAGAILTAHHSCMGCRGVRQPDARMVTSATHGVIRNDAREEFLRLAID